MDAFCLWSIIKGGAGRLVVGAILEHYTPPSLVDAQPTGRWLVGMLGNNPSPPPPNNCHRGLSKAEKWGYSGVIV